MGSNGWGNSGQGQVSEDDFNQFLDISSMNQLGDSMQFEFNGFQDGAMIPRQHDTSQDAIMGNADHDMGGMLGASTPQMSSGFMTGQMMPTSAPAQTVDPISNIDAQIQYLQQQKFHQQQRQLQEQRATFFANNNRSVPPTPQSIEMPPGSGHFYSRQPDQSGHDVYEVGYQQRMKERQDMTFTPLVSPAVTPLDPHFNMDNAFGVPSSYFSPLTSPALHAQNDASSVYDYSTQSNNSPIEMDLEATPAPVAQVLDLAKKARKNNAAKTRSKPSVKNSPISKPQRRKTGPSPAIVSRVLSEVDEAQAEQHSFLPLPAASTDGSEDASVSPENLNEMPPPPVPNRRSTSKSPYIYPQSSDNSQTPTPSTAPTSIQGDQPHPATPASLMKLPASKTKRLTTNNSQDQTATEHIESLELPESISNQHFIPMDTQIVPPSSTRSEPMSSEGRSFQPLPSPVVIKRPGTSSATQSPQIYPNSVGPSARKTPTLAPRGAGRKRSTGSIQISPALLPRISPNIKPLLPGTPGMSAEDSASRLLMTKSNYQNILEGNQVPGVSYPSELSTNLTSKRTSHKIAEQGRRNRINSALTVMAGLLPESAKAGLAEESEKKDSKQSSASASANANNSKASVVEQAIVHMQSLEQENTGLKKELQELRDKLEKMKAPN